MNALVPQPRITLSTLALVALAAHAPAAAMGPIFTGPYLPICTETTVSPSIATDGDRIFLDEAVAQENMAVVLRGYRYTDAAPSAAFPQGEGREEVYCGCQRVQIQRGMGEFAGDLPFFNVPDDAPTGDYSVELLPVSATCMSGGIRATCEASQQCVEPSLFVQPSYILSTTERVEFYGNSEDTDDHPAEMTFLIAGTSGTAFGQGGEAEHLVEWTASFPAGGEDSSHLTHADNTRLWASVPLFAGSERDMAVGECREECVGGDDSAEATCLEQCNLNLALGRFNNRVEFAIGGIEYDASPSKWWGVVAGAAAGGLACVGAAELGYPCSGLGGAHGSIGVAAAVGQGINELLEDDDDNLGTASAGASLGSNWGIGSTFGPVDFTGGSGGDLALWHRSRRVAAPRILEYSVRLASVEITDNYEESNCSPPNEVFVNARAELHRGTPSLPGSVRFPSGSGTYSLSEGDTRSFDPIEGSIASGTFTPETAPASPFLYMEVGVWEKDDDNDLMGVGAQTLAIADALNWHFLGEQESTTGGLFVRRVTFPVRFAVNGWAGSDEHCWPWWQAHGITPQAQEGGAIVELEVDLTWLQAPYVN